MKTTCLVLAAAGLALMAAGVSLGEEPPNPKIDYSGFRTLAKRLDRVRQERRLSEDEFLRAAEKPGVVVLDARSRDKYEQIHIKGAVHLAFTDFTEEALAKIIPAKDTKVLIYCNNNFTGERANFADKRAPVALNIPTFINLHAYGYTNVYELGPLLDVKTTKIPFAGKSVK
ncbi:rhodanese-like domain-containing protein [Luteolibacter sp. GHJ8]|uniref:Rhodanese-like domain-containing protein n=1 Tax=Luteolibacter rhizosphaerae TaxID=2989719 RepID=A0ABT3GA89_9BACT|nr:rhodanese-like domain-containing protein [Luteolibacter rhizosphaerae]MCW1916747.1 rhodanese-like domain-containing protein [Luteolibacter rhizosphaerae]